MLIWPRLHAAKTLLVILLMASHSIAGGAKQNILLIIADDYGADSSLLYNSTITGAILPPTPHIASLAANGVVFSRAYANPVCSPTRACLLTGRYGFRTGIGNVVGGAQAPLSATEFTLPEVFNNALPGYHVAQFGKWHLANGPNTPLTIGGWTNYAGALIGQLSNYTNWSKTVNGITSTSTNYATTDLVNDATNWISARGTNAWLLWAAFNAPHMPFHLPPTNLCPHYAHLSGTTADINARPANYFGAMIEAMDTEIGRLLASLPDRANTHIIFLGDNGSPGSVIQPPFTSSRGKNTLYEGGTHVPFIISGPAIVNPNRTNDTPVNMVDVFATILEMAGSGVGAAVPSTVTIDGQSLMPALRSTNSLSRYAYSELFGSGVIPQSAVGRTLRNSQYKLIRFDDNHEEFYDLKNDPFEAINLLANVLSAAAQSNYFGLSLKLAGYQSALPPPIITGFTKSNLLFTVTARPASNLTYTLWRASVLDDLAWSPQTNAVVATNGLMDVTLTDTNTLGSQGFYRIVGTPN